MNTQVNSDEITLKEIILKIKLYIEELIKNKFLVLLILLPSLAFFIYKHFTYQPTYAAQTKFLIEGSGSVSGGLGGLLSQFGVRSSGGKFNPYKVVEVAKSKKTVKEILFQKYDDDYIINHIISKYKLDEKWAKSNEEFKNLRFKNADFQKFSKIENIALSAVIYKILGDENGKDALMTFNFDEESAVYSYKVNTKDEHLSLELIERSYTKLRFFFEEEMMENQLSTSKILKQKADSLKALMVTKSYQVANLQDKSYGLNQALPNTKKTTLEREILALSTAYSEILKSYETTDIGIKDMKPMFLTLDEPMLPLQTMSSSLLISLLKGIAFGSLISIAIVIGKKIYNDAMSSN